MTEDEFRIREEASQDPLSEILENLKSGKVRVKEASDDLKLISTAPSAYYLLNFILYPVKRLSDMNFDRMDEGQRDQMALSIMKILREIDTIGKILYDYLFQLDKDMFGKEGSE